MAGKSEKPATVKLATVPKAAKAAAAPKISIVGNPDIGPAMENLAGDKAAGDKAVVFKLKDLLTAVVAKTNAKKKDAKDIVEAALAEMADALGKGHSLGLPPLGNMRVVKSQEKGGAKTMVLRLRIGGGKDTGEDGVADPGDDS